MSTLTTKIRKVVGKGSSGYGRGMRWLLVNGTGDDQGRATIAENEQVIQSLIENFETYKLEQETGEQFISFIYKQNGEYLGSCKVSRWGSYVSDGDRRIVVDYTTIDKESIIESVRKCNGFVSFEPIK